MFSLAGSASLTGVSTGAAVWAVDQVGAGSSTVSDWAGLVTAVGGVLIGLTTLALGWRSRKDTKDSQRDELLNELLIEKLLADREQERKKLEEGP